MHQIRQALCLHLEAGLSYAQVARAVGIGKSTVGKFLLLSRAAGVDWAVAQTLSDDELEERLHRPAVPRASRVMAAYRQPVIAKKGEKSRKDSKETKNFSWPWRI